MEQLDLFLPILRELFAKHQGLKIHLSATTMFYMSIGGDDEFAPMKIDGHKDQYHTTHLERITDPTQIRSTLKGLGERLQEIVASAELQGSGWVFDNIKNLELHVARYHPVGGAAMSWTLSPQLKDVDQSHRPAVALDLGVQHRGCPPRLLVPNLGVLGLVLVIFRSRFQTFFLARVSGYRGMKRVRTIYGESP